MFELLWKLFVYFCFTIAVISVYGCDELEKMKKNATVVQPAMDYVAPGTATLNIEAEDLDKEMNDLCAGQQKRNLTDLCTNNTLCPLEQIIIEPVHSCFEEIIPEFQCKLCNINLAPTGITGVFVKCHDCSEVSTSTAKQANEFATHAEYLSIPSYRNETDRSTWPTER